MMLVKKGLTTTISLSSSKSWMVEVVNKDKVALIGTLDKESTAELTLPGLYYVEKLYGISFSSHLWYSSSTTRCSNKK